MLEIKLDEYEILAAGHTALLRITESMRQNINWGHGYKGTFSKKIADSMSGTLGELAVAKCLKVHFNYHVNNLSTQSTVGFINIIILLIYMSFILLINHLIIVLQ